MRKKLVPSIVAVILVLVFSMAAACELFVPSKSSDPQPEAASGGGGGSGSSGGGASTGGASGGGGSGWSGGGSSGGGGSAPSGPVSLGTFGGRVSLAGYLVDMGSLLEVFDDQTFNLQLEGYPNYSLRGGYVYSPDDRQVSLRRITLDTPGDSLVLYRLKNSIPEEIKLPVVEWDLSRSIALGIAGQEAKLDRTESKDFSALSSYTGFTVKVTYPDNSMNGKGVITEVRFLSGDIPSIISVNTISGDSVTEDLKINNSLLDPKGSAVHITSYIFDDINKINIEMGSYGGRIGPMITGSYFLESSYNPWVEPPAHTLRGNGNQQFDVAFPKRLRAKLDHRNFSTSYPVLTWDPYPGATNGYAILLLVRKKQGVFRSGNTIGIWERIAAKYSASTSWQLFTDMMLTEGLASNGVYPPNIVPGDVIRFEIYVLDGSRRLDINNYEGAIFMDSLTIKR